LFSKLYLLTVYRPTYRWVIPALEELPIKLRFTSTEMDQFDEILHFEIVGQKQKYQLNCRGTSAFPCISHEPRSNSWCSWLPYL